MPSSPTLRCRKWMASSCATPGCRMQPQRYSIHFLFGKSNPRAGCACRQSAGGGALFDQTDAARGISAGAAQCVAAMGRTLAPAVLTHELTKRERLIGSRTGRSSRSACTSALGLVEVYLAGANDRNCWLPPPKTKTWISRRERLLFLFQHARPMTALSIRQRRVWGWLEPLARKFWASASSLEQPLR